MKKVPESKSLVAWRLLALWLALPLLAGCIGFYFTGSNIGDWYVTLVQPPFTPPSWLFAPVWTLLYLLMGTSAYLVSRSREEDNVLPLAIFVVHLFVNAGWSAVFFTLHLLYPGTVVIVLLMLMIILMMGLFWKHSRTATYLLVPYLLWVLFAGALNLALAVLNV